MELDILGRASHHATCALARLFILAKWFIAHGYSICLHLLDKTELPAPSLLCWKCFSCEVGCFGSCGVRAPSHGAERCLLKTLENLCHLGLGFHAGCAGLVGFLEGVLGVISLFPGVLCAGEEALACFMAVL